MSTSRFSDDFKIDAIKQIAWWGYSVSDVSKRLGVSARLDEAAFSFPTKGEVIWQIPLPQLS